VVQNWTEAAYMGLSNGSLYEIDVWIISMNSEIYNVEVIERVS